MEETDVIHPSTHCADRETEACSGAGCRLKSPGESGRKGAGKGSSAGDTCSLPPMYPVLDRGPGGEQEVGWLLCTPSSSLGLPVHPPPLPPPAPGWPSFAKCSGEGKRGRRDPSGTQRPLWGRNCESWPLELEGSLEVYSANTLKAYSALCLEPGRDLDVTRLRHWRSLCAGVERRGTTNRNMMHGPFRGGRLVQPHLPEGSIVTKVTRQGSGGATAGVSWTWRHS